MKGDRAPAEPSATSTSHLGAGWCASDIHDPDVHTEASRVSLCRIELPPKTGPAAQSDRPDGLDGLAVTDIDIRVEQVTIKLDRSLKASSCIDWYERRDAIVIGFSYDAGFCSFEFEPTTD